MHNKYVIRKKNIDKWLNVDYKEGDTIIYVNKFTNAYHFNSEKAVISFLNTHRIEKEECELFRLEVFAAPLKWADKS